MLPTRPVQTGPSPGHGTRRDLLHCPLCLLLTQGLSHLPPFTFCSAVVCPGTKLQSRGRLEEARPGPRVQDRKLCCVTRL